MPKDKILVYSDVGASKQGVTNTRNLLNALCGHLYDVKLATADLLVKEPWEEATSVLVFPGGRDLPYVEKLKGKGNERIKQYVENGGSYLGICAGAYFGASAIEFEMGTQLEVSGPRELAFYPKSCKGAAFPGFVYDSEEGARDVQLALAPDLGLGDSMECYWNGGGYFEDIRKAGNCKLLASYASFEQKSAAVVHCKIGSGQAVLSSVHPEHPPVRFTKEKWAKQIDFLRTLLNQLGLETTDSEQGTAEPTPQILISSSDEKKQAIIHDILRAFDGQPECELKDLTDVFVLTASHTAEHDRNLESGSTIRYIATDEEPANDIFNSRLYYKYLKTLNIGQSILHGRVVTSTQSLLDKNAKFLGSLPHGFLSVAARQIAGRGRGGNSWLSPPGCLMLSLVLHANSRLAGKLVFVQYLFALAVVEALQYGCGRTQHKIGLCIKWPNDIYADLGSHLETSERYVKLGGILVNSSYINNSFCLVVGCGVNLSNPQPTLTVNSLVQSAHVKYGGSTVSNEAISQEEALASILNRFDTMWNTFVGQNSFEPFMQRYLQNWIHSGQTVTIQETGDAAEIVGITSDFGLLRTRNSAGHYLDLQPDGNSFDMLHGLIKKKERLYSLNR